MYGFRGAAHVVDLLSPFEMIMHWSMERVQPPSMRQDRPTSVLTPDGVRKTQECKASREAPQLLAGVDYVALEAPDRILLPEVRFANTVAQEPSARSAPVGGDALRGLRRRWYWQRRPRPHVPVWSYAKVPKVTINVNSFDECFVGRADSCMCNWCVMPQPQLPSRQCKLKHVLVSWFAT